MSVMLYRPLSECDVLTVAEFSRLFRLSESAVRRGIESGRIPGAKIGGVYRAYVGATRSYTGADAAELGKAE